MMIVNRKKRMIYLSVAFLLLIFIPFVAQLRMRIGGQFIKYSSWIDLFNGILIFSLLAISLNLLIGNAGQISIGHAGFYAIGAYSSAIFMLELSFPFFISILSAALLTGTIGFLVGMPVLRLEGHYLGIATLGLGVVVEELAHKEIFKKPGELIGPLGYNFNVFGYNLEGANRLYFGRVFGIDNTFFSYLIILTFTIGIIFLVKNLLKTKTGRALSAIRDSQTAARMMGVNLALYKNIAFGLSAFIAGLAGGLYAHLVGALEAMSFNLGVSLILLAIITIGGLATVEGSVFGAIFYVILDQRLVSMAPEKYRGSARNFVIGLVLVLVIMFFPRGLVFLKFKMKAWLAKAKA
jgi:branched-chain amino acid transport system permease protein